MPTRTLGEARTPPDLGVSRRAGAATHQRDAAFDAELRPLLPRALRLASGMLLDPSAAEDAVQEASLRAWRRHGNRRPGTDLGPWFLGIVANRCRETRRGRWAGVARFALPPEPPPAPAHDDAAAADVRAALSRLPRAARLAMVLRFYLDLDYVDVAAVLGCSEEAARSRVRRAAAAMEPALRVPENLA